jgi:mannose/fructose/N-acetylgalactosamine-specific phosphotransferase system component IIC
MAWGPVDSIPSWVWLGTLVAGGLLVAIAMGIRMLSA